MSVTDLIQDAPGDLTEAIGLQEGKPAADEEIIPDDGQATLATPVQEDEPQESTEAAKEEKVEVREEDPFESFVKSQKTPEPDGNAQVSQLQQKLARLEGELEARNQELDRIISGQKEDVKTEEPSIAFDPAVKATLKRIYEESPDDFGSAIAHLSTKMSQETIQKEVEKLKKEYLESQQVQKQEAQILQLRDQFHSGIKEAGERYGDVYQRVVDDYQENKDKSLLFRKLLDKPYLLSDPEEAVRSVGMDILMWQKTKSNSPASESVTEGVKSNASTGKASKAGVELGEEKQGKSEEEEWVDRVFNAERRGMPWA